MSARPDGNSRGRAFSPLISKAIFSLPHAVLSKYLVCLFSTQRRRAERRGENCGCRDWETPSQLGSSHRRSDAHQIDLDRKHQTEWDKRETIELEMLATHAYNRT